MEKTDAYVLRGKTGWAMNIDGAVHTGWLVGYVERGGNVYFFALNVESDDPDFEMYSIRQEIAYGILRELGVM